MAPYGFNEPDARRPRLQEHPDAPTQGWPGIRYRLNRMLNISDATDGRFVSAPEPNAQEQAERSDWDIRAWCDVVRRGVFATVNLKGGSAKTCTIANVASVFAQTTHRAPLLIDANPASGTSAQKVGREYYETITVQELLKLIEKNPDIELEDLQDVIRFTRYGVGVVSANPLAYSPGTRLHYSHWNTLLSVLKKKIPYIFVDMGNEIGDSGAQAILRDWVDVLLVTAYVGDRRHSDRGMADSLPQMAKSEKIMLNFGVNPVKVSNALGIFSGGRPEELQHYLNKSVFIGEDRRVIARHEGIALVIPHDPYLSSDEFNNHGVNLGQLNAATVEAYRQVIINAMFLRSEMLKQAET